MSLSIKYKRAAETLYGSCSQPFWNWDIPNEWLSHVSGFHGHSDNTAWSPTQPQFFLFPSGEHVQRPGSKSDVIMGINVTPLSSSVSFFSFCIYLFIFSNRGKHFHPSVEVMIKKIRLEVGDLTLNILYHFLPGVFTGPQFPYLWNGKIITEPISEGCGED